MKKESNIMKSIMIALSDNGCVVFRNNIGSYKTEDGRFIRFGVGGNGGSDLIGWTREGKFLAVETKSPTGKATAEQINFIEKVNASGGVAGIARSVEDALRLIGS
jgi:hypothetical protein